MTGGPPPAVTIGDLARPRFPPEAQELRSGMAAMAGALSLHVDDLLGAASEQTGLSDFGDDWFREPFGVLCGALRGAQLSPAGVVSIWSQLVQLLKNRLLVEDTFRRHPEVADQPVTAPIVILGLPRTGTTHLHNLIAADPAIRSLAYWESLEPVLSGREVGPGEPDPRIARTADALAMVDLFMPEFRRMHEMTVEHAHEEIQLLAVAGSTMLFETMAPMPSWRDWYKKNDQTPAYRYLRRMLQVLSWQRGGGKRWVLKSPQHLEQMPVLREVFPDATYVVTHRDPVAVTASLVMMMTYTLRMVRDEIDVPAVGRYWTDRAVDLLGGCLRDRQLLPPDQSVDVLFHEFMADDIATVRRVYAVAGQPFDDGVHRAMATFMADHPRGKFGRVNYSLTEFGLDEAELRSRFADYVDRFGVEREQVR